MVNRTEGRIAYWCFNEWTKLFSFAKFQDVVKYFGLLRYFCANGLCFKTTRYSVLLGSSFLICIHTPVVFPNWFSKQLANSSLEFLSNLRTSSLTSSFLDSGEVSGSSSGTFGKFVLDLIKIMHLNALGSLKTPGEWLSFPTFSRKKFSSCRSTNKNICSAVFD